MKRNLALVTLLSVSVMVFVVLGRTFQTSWSDDLHIGNGNSMLDSQVRLIESYGQLPLSFEANLGQTDEQVDFVSRGNGYSLFLTSAEVVLALSNPTPPDTLLQADDTSIMARKNNSLPIEKAVLHVQLVGLEELPGKANYFIGDTLTKWRTNVPTYAKVKYQDVYPGIDLVFYGNQTQLEFDFVIAPNADPADIRLGFEGADKIEINTQGDLLVFVAGELVRVQKPLVYQETSGLRWEIPSRYHIERTHEVNFQIGYYDVNQPLVIDPILTYSTYLSGSNMDEGRAIAVDSTGAAYITGSTQSIDFPTTPGAFDTLAEPHADVFVTKLSPDGSALVYSTFIGGQGAQEGHDIDIDMSGAAYITGIVYNGSFDFPTTPGAFDTTFESNEAFITKLSPNGDLLVYSTFIGGSEQDEGGGIVVDANGIVYSTGSTESSDFPTTPGAYLNDNNGNNTSYVIKLNTTGDDLIYSTFLGPAQALDIAVDAMGAAYIIGNASWNYAVTDGAFDTSNDDSDAFVTKLDPNGSSFVYSTFLGGSGYECGDGCAIAVDSDGYAFVFGDTNSADFPVSEAAFDQSHGGGEVDTFVAKLNQAGTDLEYSTLVGGSGEDWGYDLALGSEGVIYVAGRTYSPDFPVTTDVPDSTCGVFVNQSCYSADGFIAMLNPSGSALGYSTLLGGDTDEEFIQGIEVDEAGSVYVVGTTRSDDFPTTTGSFDNTPDSSASNRGAGFVAKISLGATTPPGDDVTVQPLDARTATTPATVLFESVSDAGITSVSTSEEGPVPPSNFGLGDPPVYFDIRTTAVFTPPLTICIAYGPAQYADLMDLHLLHFEGAAWVDVTTSNDTISHVICGDVNSLSPFVVAEMTYSFSGFFPPVDNPPTLNLVKAGRAIPLKFSLGGFQGLDILASGYPKSEIIACDSTAQVDGIEETSNAGSPSLSYNPDTDQYVYVWKTDKVWADTCRQLVVKLNDGTFHRANLQFKK